MAEKKTETPEEKRKRLNKKKSGILARIKKAFWGTGTEGAFKGVRDLRESQKKKLKIMEEIEK